MMLIVSQLVSDTEDLQFKALNSKIDKRQQSYWMSVTSKATSAKLSILRVPEILFFLNYGEG